MNRYGSVLSSLGLGEVGRVLMEKWIQPVARALFPGMGAELENQHSFMVRYRVAEEVGGDQGVGEGGTERKNDLEIKGEKEVPWDKKITERIAESGKERAKQRTASSLPRQQRGLDMHTDDSEVTVNVGLMPGEQLEMLFQEEERYSNGQRKRKREEGEKEQVEGYTGGSLVFCGGLGHPDHRLKSREYSHRLGRGIFHLGRLRHGALDIHSGERVNLIVWCRNYIARLRHVIEVRGNPYNMTNKACLYM